MQAVVGATKLHKPTAKPTAHRVREFLRGAGVSEAAYAYAFNVEGWLDFWDCNPAWTLRQWEELVLENAADMNSLAAEYPEEAALALRGVTRGRCT